jgi:hypothetical protein
MQQQHRHALTPGRTVPPEIINIRERDFCHSIRYAPRPPATCELHHQSVFDRLGIVDGRRAGATSAAPASPARRAHRACPCRCVQRGRADDDGAMRIAQDNLRAHRLEAVHEQQAVVEQLFVNQRSPPRLGGDHRGDSDQVGREARPDGCFDRGIDIFFAVGGRQLLVPGDKNVCSSRSSWMPRRW